MWFKNLYLFKLLTPFQYDPEALHERLLERTAKGCGTLELSSLGWQPPLGRGAELLTHASGSCIMVCARREERVLPAAVVRELLADKVAEIEESEARKVRRKEQDELKDELMLDLLPRAFIKSSRIYAYIDTQNQWLVVDAASSKKAEELVSLLRETLGTLPAKPFEVNLSPASLMTAWVSGTESSAAFQIQDECELRDTVEEGGIIRCRRQDLEGDEIRTHLEAGKQVVKLALEWGERLGFVLSDDFSIKRLKFLDIILEEAATAESEDAATRFDVDFSLMSLELQRFITDLIEIFGGLADER
ncbi:recombination-associated protein RdgC [Sedimenticola selenatireducens]|uniref:Recombination-associated protein RdgC n=1 Tax=Sedimenticola selenatireducens TaxID=191960 RepID=A0A558E263_9GAMM|nr:recombination-associated protein RdgC [Sedimenticola selenatireducens]TVO79020.1 recombination-associated protein RdgC [Sedimenticola selenatireducens]TVT67188.1 MAG: recombination-associated protein RdgC [Sedimenticola selenatireducens]